MRRMSTDFDAKSIWLTAGPTCRAGARLVRFSTVLALVPHSEEASTEFVCTAKGTTEQGVNEAKRSGK